MENVELEKLNSNDAAVDIPDSNLTDLANIVSNWEAEQEPGGVPILNEYTGDVKDEERGKDMVFQEGGHRIDYVLVWSHKGDKQATLKHNARQIFEENLRKEGLLLEPDVEEGRTEQYMKIHAPLEVLTRYAELLKIRMPIKETPEEIEAFGIWDMMTGCISKCFELFELDKKKVPQVPKRFSYVYERSKKYLFCCPENQLYLFSHATRSRIVDYILRRKEYSDDSSSRYNYGVKRLLSDGTYLAAYPLHEGSWKPNSRPNIRKILYDNWASWRVWFKIQPLSYVRLYFGERIGLYFAWLGYYSYALVFPSIIGVLVFIYGLLTMKSNTISIESCDAGNNFTMCPLCNRHCGFWSYDQICLHMTANHLFDNGATVFFAVFMSLWATIYLEFWKREQAGVQFLWDLRNFEEEEEPPRPEYFSRTAKSRYTKVNKKTGLEERFYPFWRRQVPVYLTSTAIMFTMILIALATVVGVIIYRISVLAALYMLDDARIIKNATLIVSITAALINLLIIFILNFIYSKLATMLTDWECLKTQSEYDDSLTFKFYVLQFVNYYSSLFYIAFFKGRFSGTPNDHIAFANGGRQEECQGSCLTELCVQLSIIFVGKQLIQNTLMEIYLPRIKRWVNKTCFLSKEHKEKKLKPWEKDYTLEEMGSMGLFNEYLEMMIQFGFVTLFVAAFPLAPFFALINNIIELRSDANKFVTQFRREMALRAATIGIWYDILYGLSRFAIVTNALIIAFTSSFIQRELYKAVYSPTGTLEGFVNNSLSYFSTSDFSDKVRPLPSDVQERYNNTEMCRYYNYREPPWSSRKYEYSAQFWNLVAAQFIFVCIFENVIILVTSIVAYIIPDIPSKLRQQLRQESILTNEIVLETELKRARGEGESLSQEEMKNIRRRAILMLDSVDSRSNALKVIVNKLQSKNPDDSSPKIATVSS